MLFEIVFLSKDCEKHKEEIRSKIISIFFLSFIKTIVDLRPGAWLGWALKMGDFSVKDKFLKYKTNFY